MALTAREAAQHVNETVKGWNNSRRLQPVPASLKKFMDENRLYIHNVGPWSHERSMGSLGTYYIPKCEDGKAYATMTRELPGIVMEPIPVNESTFSYNQDDGRYVADQIMGVGSFLNPINSLMKFGVFISDFEKPTKEELAAAQVELKAHFENLVSEARRAYEQGPAESEGTIRAQHRLAALKLNLPDEAWLKNATPTSRQKCPVCGTMAGNEQIMCASCKYIFDETKYKALTNRFAK